MDYLAAFLLGDVTLRQLHTLIRWLPESSALHRSVTDGREWTLSHQIQWQGLHLLQVLDAHLLQVNGNKQAKLPKFLKTPWSKPGSKRTLGRRGGLSDQQVGDWIASLRPKSKST